jgi:hypothetical protein
VTYVVAMAIVGVYILGDTQIVSIWFCFYLSFLSTDLGAVCLEVGVTVIRAGLQVASR